MAKSSSKPTAEELEELRKHPFGQPLSEYMQFKGFRSYKEVESEQEVTNHDLLVAFLRAANSIHHELVCIRKSLEGK
jgi:hypothetical protein